MRPDPPPGGGRPAPGSATLVIRPAWSWTDEDRPVVEEEGRRLVAWVAPGEEAYEIAFAAPA